MKVDVGIWSKLTRAVIFLIIVAFVMAAVVCYYPLLRQNENMRKVIFDLDAQIQQEDNKARQLHSAIDAISTDPKTIERVAREKLGYAKPGETVIRFEDPANVAPVALTR